MNPSQINTQEVPDLYEQICFRSIDDAQYHWSQKFQISLLRVGRILMQGQSEYRELRATRIARLMNKHHTKMLGYYSPLKIRECLSNVFEGEVVGGGIRADFYTLSKAHRKNDPPHFGISFSPVYRQQDCIIKIQSVVEPKPLEGDLI